MRRGLAAYALEDGERLRLHTEGEDGDESKNEHVRHLKYSIGNLTMPLVFHSHVAHSLRCFKGDSARVPENHGRLRRRFLLATTLRR